MSSSPASSSLPLPPARPSPFSLLPPELVQSIIESTVAHSFESTTYGSRQATLRSLCLVSKFFYEIAQPLLLAIVFLKAPRDNANPVVPSDIHRKYCRTAVFLLNFRRNNELLDVLAGFRHLHQLTITRDFELNFEAISHLSDSLTVLQISRTTISIGSPRPFKHLKELSITWCRRFKVEDLLKPSLYPALEVLAFYADADDYPKYTIELKAFDDFFRSSDELDLLTLDLQLVRRLDKGFVKRISSSLLVDCNWYEIEEDWDMNSEFINVRVSSVERTADGVAHDLLFMAESLQEKGRHRILILSEDCISSPTDNDRIIDARAKLLEKAKAINVEIMTELESPDWEVDYPFPPVLRAKRRAERMGKTVLKEG